MQPRNYCRPNSLLWPWLLRPHSSLSLQMFRLCLICFCFHVIFQIIVKKREPLNLGNQDVTAGFSSRLAATQDVPFIHQSVSMFSSLIICSFQTIGSFFVLFCFFPFSENKAWLLLAVKTEALWLKSLIKP